MKDVDFFCFGPVPTEEDCVQVSKNGEYLDEMKAEALRYKEFLQRRFPNSKCVFRLERSAHEFGEYIDVVARYHVDDMREYSHALFVENNLPKTWSDKKVFNMEEVEILEDDEEY